MGSDEKMFNIGLIMFSCMIFFIVFLQLCYREQNNNLISIRQGIDSLHQQFDKLETKFSTLSSADSLRGSVIGINPKAETVSFNKTVSIDDIPMVE